MPPGTDLSPEGQGGDESLDSDGGIDALGSATLVTLSGTTPNVESDFGFKAEEPESGPPPPGTGTPGYWKNHTQVWAGMWIGGVYYTSGDSSAQMGKVSKDKTISLFSQLVAAKLNVEVGNDDECIADSIAAADAWMTSHPVSSGVTASSTAWQGIAQAHKNLDDYNNGRLCAPHRN